MKRYERQMILPGIGTLGQQKLADARVLIIGIGGLGCPVLQNLAAAGIGTIGIVDGDVIDENNLHRQFLYTPKNCGKSKVAVAAKAIGRQNPQIEIITYPVHFSQQNCFLISSDYQLIVDCTDNIRTRYLINDVAVAKEIPMVYASVHKFEGQLSVFNYRNGPTYRCLFPEDDRLEAIPHCNDSGVLGVLTSALGSMQANEVLKIILGIGDVLSGKLMLYNNLDNGFQIIEIQKNKNFTKPFVDVDKAIDEAAFFAEDDCLIIDIREEYEEPKLELEKIKNVPLSGLDNFLKEMDQNQRIVLICQNGTRSEQAVGYLTKNGFTNVYHLENGIESLTKLSNDDK